MFIQSWKNLHAPAEVVFVPACLNIPFCRHTSLRRRATHTATPSLDAWLKKVPTDMTATKQHRNLGRSEAHQTSHQYRIIKGLAKVVGCIIGLIVALIMWVVVRPILRGVGWLISILTMIAIIYWLMTL